METSVVMATLTGLTFCVISLILILTIHKMVKVKPKYVMSRLFLKKGETIKAFISLVIGTSLFAITMISRGFYVFNVIRYNLYITIQIAGSLGFQLCLIYAFYVMLKVIRR